MKRTALITGCAFICTLGITFYYTGMYFYTHATEIVSCSFSLDPLFSETTQQYIRSALSVDTYSTVQAYRTALNKISTKIPAIHSTRLNISAQNNVHTTIISRKPTLFVNTETILSNDGTPLQADFFSESTRASLPHITTIDKPNYKKVFTWFAKNDPQMVNLYRIHWKNEDAIFLHNKNNPNNLIICTAQQTLKNSNLTLCKNLLSKSQEKKVNKKKMWIADMRFAHQIIIYQEDKEEFHGSLFI